MRVILFLCLLFAGNIYAQVVTVKDNVTERPLEYVAIYSSDLNRSLSTDANGKVNISSLKGSKKITFRLIGYELTEKKYDEIVANNNIVYMSESAIPLANVVVSTKRWGEDRSDASNAIEIITPKDIQFQNPQTAADMLMQSGNVYVQKSQLGGGSPMIRGFATNRVLIVVDNIRMNNAIFRSGNIQNVISLDANSLTNAQVVFGPGSVMYGSDAIGGIMEFSTIAPQFSYSGQTLFNGAVATRYSSANNEKMGHFHFGIGLEKWGFLTSASFSAFGDLRMGSNGPDDYLRTFYQDRIDGRDTMIMNNDPELQKLSGYEQFNLMQKVRFKPNNDLEFNYGFHYSRVSDVPRYDRLIEMKGDNPRSAQWFYGPQKWMMNSLSITNYRENGLYDLTKLIVAHQFFEESRNDRNFNNTTLRHRTEKVNAVSINLDLVKKLNEVSQLYYGVETVFNKVSSIAESENIIDGSSSPLSTRYPNGSIWNSYGAYVTYKNKLSTELILQAGMRYNVVYLQAEFDTTFFPFPFTDADLTTGALTGSAGLVWHPNPSWQINLNLSTGFRAPNIDDVGKIFDSEPGAVIVPNPDLKSEYIYSTELGIAKTFGKNLKVDVTAFYSYLDDALVRRDFLLNGADSIFYDGTLSKVEAIQNAAFAQVWGIQGGIDFRFTENFEFVSKLSWQNGEEEDDGGDKVPLRHAPPWYGTTRLIFTKDNFNAMIYADYNGEISYDDLAPSERSKVIYALDENGNPYSPAWYTLNLKLGYLLFKRYQLNFGIENITDQRYRPYSSGITAPGVNFIGSLRVNI